MSQNAASTNNNDNLVEIRGVSFSYNTRTILDNLTLSIPRGKVTAIMGGSGCGKTSLLNLIGGRLRPSRGQVLVDGLNVPDLDISELYQLRKRMGMLFQHGALLTDLSVFENVAFPIRE
ncbi:MAG: ATP-binding cassette domain-containing protein, partial [Sulfuricaulis sp.]|nr:ATP-binding cassette domain-containing protein [Sulfuricaulis sp.]